MTLLPDRSRFLRAFRFYKSNSYVIVFKLLNEISKLLRLPAIPVKYISLILQ